LVIFKLIFKLCLVTIAAQQPLLLLLPQLTKTTQQLI
jgi:hypothetical protein